MDDEIELNASEVQDQVIPGVSAGALLDAMENPETFASVARGDLYVQLAHMRRLANSPEMTFPQRVEYSKLLAKMGKVEAPEKSGEDMLAGVPPIQIILPNSGGQVNIGHQAIKPVEKDERDVTPKQATAVLP
jgi:hypothetical protein